MDPQRRAEFDHGVAIDAARCFGLELATGVKVEGFENFVVPARGPSGPVVLRIADARERTRSRIEAELAFIRHLHARGLRVAAPVESTEGRWVEGFRSSRGVDYFATAFHRARGEPCRRFPETPGRVALGVPWAMGAWLGRAHRAASEFCPQLGLRRPHAAEDDSPIEAWLHAHFPALVSRLAELERRVRGFPRNDDGYGLIHRDLHPGNFFVAEPATLEVFDFDDCARSHFAEDLAIALLAGLIVDPRVVDRQQLNQRFYDELIAGYESQRRIERAEIARIPVFLALREIVLLAVNQHCLTDAQRSPFWRYLIRERPRAIVDGRPLVDLTWY